jgi:hypothetical protein
MDTSILTAIIQAVIQIATILGGIWALFNTKANEIERKFESRLNNIEYALRISHSDSIKKNNENRN